MALCGVLCALALVILLLGGVIPAALYACPMLAMLVLLPILSECGPRLAGAAYGAVAILAVLLVPDKELAAVYVFFGCYPLLRPRLERLPSRPLRLLAKLAFCNAAIFLMYALLLFVFQLDALTEEYASASRLMIGALAAMGNVIFLLLDRAIGRMTVVWETRLRRRFFPPR